MDAKACARLSGLIYQDLAIFEAEAISYGFDSAVTFGHANMQAGMAWKGDAMALVFRGTEGANLVWADFRASIRSKSYSWAGRGAIHEGYLWNTQKLWPYIRPHLQKFSGDIILTGHSLGGAMATAAAAQMQVAGDVTDAARLVTFGSPKVGDKEFVDWLKVPHDRYMNGLDLVPYYPPLFGYAHHGTPIKVWSHKWGRPLGYHDIAEYEAAI